MITIVDPSIDAQVSGLKCLIFNSDLNAMPKVLDVGNIVRFHRLKVGPRKKRSRALGQSVFRNPRCSFVIFVFLYAKLLVSIVM